MNKEKTPEEARDLRIDKAKKVKSLLKHEGYIVLKERLEELKEDALYHLTDMQGEDDRLWKGVYNKLKEAINLPEVIISEGEEGVIDSEEDRRAETEVKESVPYLQRRY